MIQKNLIRPLVGANRILNIGNDNAVNLLDFISTLEQELGLKAIKEFVSFQKGDVINTLSDNSIINKWIGNYQKTTLRKGVQKFVNWYIDYYK